MVQKRNKNQRYCHEKGVTAYEKIKQNIWTEPKPFLQKRSFIYSSVQHRIEPQFQ
jgi:hypothetical protein